jgi:hypothetical protein
MADFKPETQKSYINELVEKKKELNDQLGKIPDAFAYSNKRWRFQSDIEQLQWRVNYLNTFIKNKN